MDPDIVCRAIQALFLSTWFFSFLFFSFLFLFLFPMKKICMAKTETYQSYPKIQKYVKEQ